jgi:ribosome-binding protein aMBF1 (putative translation factor)
MGNFTTIKLTESELKLINDNYYKTGQEKKWKSKRAEKKMYRATSAEQNRNEESEKNCKKRNLH